MTSTPAFIGKLLSNGTVSGVYCHYEGQHVGALLRTHYSAARKVNKLLKQGDLARLGTTTENSVRWERLLAGRPRKEPIDYVSLERMAKGASPINYNPQLAHGDYRFEFFYVFDGKGWLTLEPWRGRWLTEAELAI